MGSDIERARDVLPGTGWSACGLHGREFVPGDLPDLVRLGQGDEFFAWERVPQAPKYFEGLLQFRLGHYWKYGFGVHGLWLGDALVGQFGLQVLSDEQDEVEFAIFLGKEYKHRGLGTCLTRFLVGRCRMSGLSAIYGVVRIDNPDGIALMDKLSGAVIGRKRHFGEIAEIFRIPLDKDAINADL